MPLDDIVEEGEAAALASERAFANAREVGILVELATVEDCHDAGVLHMSVLHDGIEDYLAVGIDILQLMPRHLLEECRHGEDGTRAEPAAHMVARDMVEHGVARYLEDVVLQLLQVVYAHYLLACDRIAEDKVTKAHVLLHDALQVYAHLLAVLVYEAETLGLSTLAVVAVGAFHDERHVFVLRTDGTQKLQACL